MRLSRRRLPAPDDLPARAVRTLSELTDEQRAAVGRRSGPLLLAAGAGSGKTSVLVERFVSAVREDGVAPGRILAITFTDRAAGELRIRVRRRLLELGEREAARDTEAAYVTTFHGFCARVLRGRALAAGLDPQFAILDDAFAGRLRERAFGQALADIIVEGSRREAVDVVAAYGADRLRGMIVGVYQELRSRGQGAPRLPDAAPRARGDGEPAERGAVAVCAVLADLLAGFGDRYGALKQERGALDFDDLEIRARDLLQGRESVRRGLSERFDLLMVDEFQDTNARQLAILAALERDNLFTVGDEQQAIYGFRHADVSLFRARRAALDGRGGSLELTINFRSRPEILDVVNAIFEERFGDRHMALIAERETSGGDEPLVELLLSGTAGWGGEDVGDDGVPEHWRRAEAQALAERIAALLAGGETTAGDVAVLLRSAGDLDMYEEALRRVGLSTLASVGAYWERLEVVDLLGYLRVLANPRDELALYGALAGPLAGISADGLALIAAGAQAAGGGAWEVLGRLAGEVDEGTAAGGPEASRPGPLTGLTAWDRSLLVRFTSRLTEERRMASRRTLAELIERAVGQSGYGEKLLALEWGERRLANVHKLIRLARRYEATEGRDLRGFLNHVAYLQSNRAGAEPDAPAAGSAFDAVQLMTVHAAKGLEFPVVCVADLGRRRNLPTPDLLVDGDRIGLRLLTLEGGDASSALDFDDLWAESRRRQGEEEERIFYVAMTRARERLLLSGAVDFERWPQGERAPAISWLGPAISGELTDILAGRGAGVTDLSVGGDGRGVVRLRVNTAEATRARSRAQGATAPAVAAPPEPEQLQLDLATAGPPASTPVRRPGVGPLSYTALAGLERCGYRYYLEQVIGLGEDRSAARGGRRGADELIARTRGTLIHRLLEDVDFRGLRLPDAGDVERVASELGVRVEPGERDEILAMLLTVARAAAAGLEPAVRVASAGSVHREYPFAFSLGPDEPLLSGVIDVLAREPDGGVLVLDYKSDRLGQEEDLEALTERDYSLQRLLYALAILREGAPSVDVIHWYLRRPHEWATLRHLASERPALETQLRERIGSVLSDPFTVSSTPHRDLCATCPGRRRLCSWTDAETLRDLPGG